MEKAEILVTSVGEMRDMIACLSIYHGAKPRKIHRKTGFLDTLEIE